MSKRVVLYKVMPVKVWVVTRVDAYEKPDGTQGGDADDVARCATKEEAVKEAERRTQAHRKRYPDHKVIGPNEKGF